MGNIGQLLERGFMGGVVFSGVCAGAAILFYLLCESRVENEGDESSSKASENMK